MSGAELRYARRSDCIRGGRAHAAPGAEDRTSIVRVCKARPNSPVARALEKIHAGNQRGQFKTLSLGTIREKTVACTPVEAR